MTFSVLSSKPLGAPRSINPITRLLLRLRYPVSLPEDLSLDLGIPVPNTLSFRRILEYLTNPARRLGRLHRYMPRREAEKMFDNAVKKECFQQRSLYSYYFDGAWVEFVLNFDDDNRLRRVYLLHKSISDRRGVELALAVN